MTRALITEQRLIEAINLALLHDWPHKDCHCKVAALRKVEHPKRNWEVEVTSVGGANLLHTEKCERLLEKVLSELDGKYNVQWPT
jgi:hypothetical protein